MKVNYSIAFKIDGVWSEDYNFKRDVYAEQPLDETLDTGVVVDVPSSLRKIAPFTLCRVTATEADTDTEIFKNYYWTADRETEAVTLFGVGNEIGNLAEQKYKQNIKLIELTKILEREPCDSLSFTHRLQRDAIASSAYISPTVENAGNGTATLDGDINTIYRSPTRSLTLYYIRFNPAQVWTSVTNRMIIEIYDSGDNILNDYTYVEGNPSHPTGTPILSYTLPDGTYKIKYTIAVSDLVSYQTKTITYSNIVITNASVEGKPIPSITDVINRILDVGTPRPSYISPKYTIDPVIASMFADTKAPEFFFPRMTMFEALLEVGKKIHAIPRLIVDENEEPTVITYDLLGLDEEYELPDGATIVGYKNLQSADDYCGAIDSYVENHINTVDPNAGTVTEPFDGGFKTLRCESGVKITNSTAVFEAPKPIYRVIKFEMAYTENSPRVIGDITPYVYEQSEYDGLSASSNSQYPDSVAFALVWKQGDRFIRGFNTTSESLLNIIQQFNTPAINNIANSVLSGSMEADDVYSNLAFRLEYIPMDSLRLRQYKPYGTHPDKNILYNQQNANTVEGSYYGESLKGKIARMGNEVEVYTIRYTDSSQEMPKIGNLLIDEDGEEKGYIFKVTTRGAKNFIVADVYVTPDFNRISEYFSLDSNFRLFEVSERQSIDRQVIVPRVIEVSLNESTNIDEPKLAGGISGENPYIQNNRAVQRFMRTFTQSDYQLDTISRPTVAAVRLVDNAGQKISGNTCFALPVNSTACGNSLAFSFGFADSFSAGKRAMYGGDELDPPLSYTYKWKQQRNTQYGDAFGSFYGLEFGIADSIYDTFTDGDGTKYTRYGPTKEDQYDPSENGTGFDDNLPALDDLKYIYTMTNAFFSTLRAIDANNGVRVVDKNSSEHISVVVQFHGRAMDKKIVFGTAMWNNNLLIRDEAVKALDADGNPTATQRAKPRVFGLKSGRLNMLRNKIDVHMVGSNVVTGTNIVDLGASHTITVAGNGVGRIEPVDLVGHVSQKTTIKAWCIADPTNGEIYIGVNETIVIDPTSVHAYTSAIFFNFDREA